MKESQPLPFPTRDFQSNYPLITKEDVTIGRIVKRPMFLFTDDEHSHVLNAVQIDLPPSDTEIRLTEQEMKDLFYTKTESFSLQKVFDAQKKMLCSDKFANGNNTKINPWLQT